MSILTSRTDADLKSAVLQELEWTPSVDAVNIGVSVTDGAVTLSGEVDSYPDKEQAERAALRVRGVLAVADEIVVRSLVPTNDTDVARHAAEAIEHAVDVPDHTVKVTVRHGVVTLTGAVAWQYQRDAARRAVAYLKGVRGVVNDIKIHRGGMAADAKAAIVAALHRNAQVEAQNITVTATPDGTVRLSGSAHSWFERQQAEHAAWSAPGVTDVENELRVQF
ncbi:Osmotically-inducible protein OsmY, contains BON domain [Nakamurella panacisegetis]|uniref:Osmotically-inducible protein OsmY, contains BON domain n=1 Tax=Nakamurella panacisegetis TaxID=1090615 RepID=A0A1H0SB83_9ACTN|nr:BON domain-containing protein [Nakamurella panacisegetis]SDP38498.1 Osmotically-inducible protein OsmY, contains BON domain [Nakamurella panacisegetis]